MSIWCWRRMEYISWSDHVRNEEALQRVENDRNILQKKERKKERKLTEFFTYCVGTAFENTMLKE
jgi:hypothetical protein